MAPTLKPLSLVLAASLAACSAEAPPAPVLLPTAANLPYDLDQDCGCVALGDCPIYELSRIGDTEIRNVSCRWITPERTAECRYEARFIPLSDDGLRHLAPEPWQRQTLRATRLPDGRWCRNGP